MFNMQVRRLRLSTPHPTATTSQLLTLTSLIMPIALASPMPVQTAITPNVKTAIPIIATSPFPAVSRGPPYSSLPGYTVSGSAPVATIAPPLPTTTTTATGPANNNSTVPSGGAVALLAAHHLPDCLASDSQSGDYIIWANTCYKVPTSFLSYTAKVTDVDAGQTCVMHVYSEGDCSGFESQSGALTGSMGKCTPTSLRVVDGLAGVGAVAVKMMCA